MTVGRRNAALVLMSDGRVHGVVQVRREALEKHPELLERLREEARHLYAQTIIIEENLEEVPPERLRDWLQRMNPAALEEDSMPWEEAARWAISGAIDGLEWRKEAGSVVLTRNAEGPMGPSYVECVSLEHLIAELDELGQSAWSGEVPVDGGGQSFDLGDTIDVRGMLDERCGQELKEIGWG